MGERPHSAPGQGGFREKKFAPPLISSARRPYHEVSPLKLMKNRLHACKALRPTAEHSGMAVRSYRRATFSTAIDGGWNRKLGSGVY
jgi:hypothetical protein